MVSISADGSLSYFITILEVKEIFPGFSLAHIC